MKYKVGDKVIVSTLIGVGKESSFYNKVIGKTGIIVKIQDNYIEDEELPYKIQFENTLFGKENNICFWEEELTLVRRPYKQLVFDWK